MMDNAPKRSTPGSIPGQELGRTSVIFEVFLTDEIRSRISFMPEHTCPRRGVKSQMCRSTFKPKDSAAAMNNSVMVSSSTAVSGCCYCAAAFGWVPFGISLVGSSASTRKPPLIYLHNQRTCRAPLCTVACFLVEANEVDAMKPFCLAESAAILTVSNEEAETQVVTIYRPKVWSRTAQV